MSVRIFSPADVIPASVEPLNSGLTSGCIVRWDFQPVISVIPHNANRAPSRRRKFIIPDADQEAPASDQPLPVEVDAHIVAFSEMRYIGIPDPDHVIADIQADLLLRYPDQPQPEIDLDAYRAAVAALNIP